MRLALKVETGNRAESLGLRAKSEKGCRVLGVGCVRFALSTESSGLGPQFSLLSP